MCFPKIKDIKPGMKLPADYLKRTGYRLPTEVEWEYACRAGTETAWSFGNAEELLDQYAWSIHTLRNHAWRSGLRKPNDFGLFDMHGNAQEWTLSLAKEYPPDPPDGSPLGDSEENSVIGPDSAFVIRGGSFANLPSSLRSAYRAKGVVDERDGTVGFRIARTVR